MLMVRQDIKKEETCIRTRGVGIGSERNKQCGDKIFCHANKGAKRGTSMSLSFFEEEKKEGTDFFVA